MKKLFSRKVNIENKSKGSVLLLTLIIGNLILLLSLYLISKVESMSFYNSNLSKFILKEDAISKKREYLMSRFNSYLTLNFVGTSEEELHEFFMKFNDLSIVTYEDARIRYDKLKKEFFIETIVERSNVVIDKFIVEVSENTIKYKF
ncbi:hypothetical protein [Clostridium sp.]|uniref:hypothetical protein n=1 Tax=Clostridium sp. TaxID=1506 RepID=UPI002FCB1E8F